MRLVNRTFDELQPGERAEVRRLVTADDLYVFAVSSGNFNPMHLPHTDLDGDGTTEIIAATVSGQIQAWTAAGVPLSGTGMTRSASTGDSRAS